VLLLQTGESVSFHGDDHFPMQSVYKLPICMAALQQVDAGKVSIDQQVRVEKSDLVPRGHSPMRDAHPEGGFEISFRELIRLAIEESDGSASDVLLRLMGGTAPVMSMLQELGIDGIVVVNPERELQSTNDVQYRNWATPNQAVKLLNALAKGQGLSRSSQDLLLKFMRESTPGEHRIKGMLPVGTAVAHKTGTSFTEAGITAATNDVGLVTLPGGRTLAIAVFVSDSPASDEARDHVIAEIARAAWDWAVTR